MASIASGPARMVIDWPETCNRLTMFFNEHNDAAMASQASSMVRKMKSSGHGELMGLVAMLRQKYQGDTFLFPMFDLNRVHDQLKKAFTKKAPSNLSQLQKMVVAVGKGDLPLDQLQTMMYQKLQVMIEVEHSFIDITGANKAEPSATASALPTKKNVAEDITSDTTDADGVRTVVRRLEGGGTSTTKSGGNGALQRKNYELMKQKDRADAAKKAATAKRNAQLLAERNSNTVVIDHTWMGSDGDGGTCQKTATITSSMPCGLCKFRRYLLFVSIVGAALSLVLSYSLCRPWNASSIFLW
jgi:hypothetical protein